MNSPRASACATTLVKASNIEELLFSTSGSRVGGEGVSEGVPPKTELFFRQLQWLYHSLYKGSSLAFAGCLPGTVFRSAGIPIGLLCRLCMQKARPIRPSPMRIRSWISSFSCSVHRRDIGDPSALAMNHLLGFQHLVKGHEAHGVCTFVETVIVQPTHFDSVHPGLLADPLSHRCD